MSEPIAAKTGIDLAYVSVRVAAVRRGSRRRIVESRVTSAADWPRGPIVPESSGEGSYAGERGSCRVLQGLVVSFML
jgi:hypothetical protein